MCVGAYFCVCGVRVSMCVFMFACIWKAEVPLEFDFSGASYLGFSDRVFHLAFSSLLMMIWQLSQIQGSACFCWGISMPYHIQLFYVGSLIKLRSFLVS